jgi:predicted N-acyltransferase
VKHVTSFGPASGGDTGDVVEVATDLGDIEPTAWNALVAPDDPFMEYEFLDTLHEAGAVGEETTWQPRYLTLRRGGRLVAAAPFYVKWDSYGEFIFDWQWADAYHRARVPYYPKVVVAAPFTPATGRRLLVHPEASFDACAGRLAAELIDYAEREGLSGVHVLFLSRDESEFLASRGFMPRITQQYHWENRGYGCFDDFLADLRSSKRKQIVKERRAVAGLGLTVEVIEGEAIREEHVEALWDFYVDTTGRKWGQPYLNRECFTRLLSDFRHRLVLVMARDAGRWVAGTLNVYKGSTLYGRYWGTSGDYPGLHFECCYYRLIEYAIGRGLVRFEAGAQGEHKFLRGFAARPTYSAHALFHPGGRAAIAAYLEAEREAAADTIERYNRLSPLKHVRGSA